MSSQSIAHPTQRCFVQATSQAHFCSNTVAQPDQAQPDQPPNFSSVSSMHRHSIFVTPDTSNQQQGTVTPHFCSLLPAAFYLTAQHKSWSGGDATVLDSNGELAFTLDATALSVRRCRVLKDAAGLPVCAMQEKVSLLLVLGHMLLTDAAEVLTVHASAYHSISIQRHALLFWSTCCTRF